MIRINKIIIVEGKYDKIKLSSFIDAVIVETDGFGIFKDKEKQRFIRKAASEKGVIILTDSDSAGFLIRGFISSIIPSEYITNVYIPDLYGKEKRKETYSKEGKIGVEGVSIEILLDAFKKSGIVFENDESFQAEKKVITAYDLYVDGLCGCADSNAKKSEFLRLLQLPERLSNKAMLKIINSFIGYDEYKKTVGRMSCNDQSGSRI